MAAAWLGPPASRGNERIIIAVALDAQVKFYRELLLVGVLQTVDMTFPSVEFCSAVTIIQGAVL